MRKDRSWGLAAEAGLLTRHLACWLEVLETMVPHRQPRIELSVFDHPVLTERLAGTVRPGLAEHAAYLVDEPGRTRGRGCYAGFALRITAKPNWATAGSPPGPRS